MKTPENDQQKLFFDLVAAGTSVRDATVEANYTYRYGYELIRNTELKNGLKELIYVIKKENRL